MDFEERKQKALSPSNCKGLFHKVTTVMLTERQSLKFQSAWFPLKPCSVLLLNT